MAGENDIGGKVGLDITDFKAGISELNRQIKIIDTGFKAAAAGMDGWGKSEEGLNAKIKSLNDITDLQRQKIEQLNTMYAKSSAEKGENSKAAQDLQIRINKETEALNKNEAELKRATEALGTLRTGSDGAAEKVGDLDAKIKATESGFRASVAGMDDWRESSEGLNSRIDALNQTTDLQRQKIEQLNTMYAKSSAEKGENAKETQDLLTAINNETASLGKNESELRDTEKALGDYGNETEDAGKKTSIFGDVLKANLATEAIKLGLQGLVDVIKKVGGAVKNYIAGGSAAADAAAENHAKLTQVMRNTMAATDEETASIVELTEAQEKLGVVSAPTQLGGAQELGTYLEETENLKTLIPTMNDMIAQQYGVNASQEAAAGIATMLGKVMNGQVGALSRYGYTFDEAQEQILKYGTEAERAAVLADVVGESVGGMNVALGQTDAGKMERVNAALGKTQERVGEIANATKAAIMGSVLPDIEAASDAFLAILAGEGSVEEASAAVSGLVTGFVDSLLEQLPALIDTAGKLVEALVTGIAESAPKIVDGAVQLLGMIVKEITRLLPTIISAGLSIVSSLLEGIVDALPDIIKAAKTMIKSLIDAAKTHFPTIFETAIELVFTLIDGIIDALPELIPAALDLIVTLATAIIDALPKLIEKVPEIVIAIVETIAENLPYIIRTALDLIITLANGIIDALPKLIDKIPQIVEAIVDTIAENLPLLVLAAIDLIIALVTAIIKNLPMIIESAGKIVGALIGGILDLLWKLGDVAKDLFKELGKSLKNLDWAQLGKNIVDGIINGIKNAGKAMGNALKDIGTSALKGVKNLFDINSPSRVMRDEVGLMIGAGLADGIEASQRQVAEAMKQLNGAVEVNPTIVPKIGAKQATATGDISITMGNMFAGATFNVQTDSQARIIAVELGDVITSAVRGQGAFA